MEEEKKKIDAEEDADMQLARQLQEQFEAEEAAMRKEREETNITCKICLDEIEPQDYLPLENCGCMFHPDCVKEHFQM